MFRRVKLEENCELRITDNLPVPQTTYQHIFMLNECCCLYYPPNILQHVGTKLMFINSLLFGAWDVHFLVFSGKT